MTLLRRTARYRRKTFTFDGRQSGLLASALDLGAEDGEVVRADFGQGQITYLLTRQANGEMGLDRLKAGRARSWQRTAEPQPVRHNDLGIPVHTSAAPLTPRAPMAKIRAAAKSRAKQKALRISRTIDRSPAPKHSKTWEDKGDD